MTNPIELWRTGKEATKMVRWTTSMRVLLGKGPQAIKFAKESTEFINKKYKVQMSAYMDIFGEYGTIRIFINFADLATLEKFMNQALADQEYLKIRSQAAELIIQGSRYDTVMHSI
jgi:hypothetical protein